MYHTKEGAGRVQFTLMAIAPKVASIVAPPSLKDSVRLMVTEPPAAGKLPRAKTTLAKVPPPPAAIAIGVCVTAPDSAIRISFRKEPLIALTLVNVTLALATVAPAGIAGTTTVAVVAATPLLLNGAPGKAAVTVPDKAPMDAVSPAPPGTVPFWQML